MRGLRRWSSALIGAALLAGCDDDPAARQHCEIVSHSSSNRWDLDYQLLLPSPCPAPLGRVGEKKVAAGEIYDKGTRDFEFAELLVTNSADKVVADNIVRFIVRTYPTASPRVEYPAATGAFVVGDHLSSQHWDYGRFTAFNRGELENLNNPFGTVQITYRKAAVSTSIHGPVVPAANTTHTWEAIGRDGDEPYAFRWFRDGVAVGTGRYYTSSTGVEPFGLRLEVTDASYSTSATVLAVDVGGVRVQIQGPDHSFMPEGSTWTASGTGGATPYTFEWFLDDVFIGAGATWTGYPGEGMRRMHVHMRDASGASHSDVREVFGFGSDECIPEPGALTCVS